MGAMPPWNFIHGVQYPHGPHTSYATVKHKLENITPTSGVVDGNSVVCLYIAKAFPMLLKAIVPSLQLQNPLVSYKVTKIHQS